MVQPHSQALAQLPVACSERESGNEAMAARVCLADKVVVNFVDCINISLLLPHLIAALTTVDTCIHHAFAYMKLLVYPWLTTSLLPRLSTPMLCKQVHILEVTIQLTESPLFCSDL